MLIKAIKPSHLRIFTCARPSIRYFCDNKDKKDDKKPTPEAEPDKNENKATNRLNELLNSMSQETLASSAKVPTFYSKKEKKAKAESSDSSDDESKDPKNIVKAAKNVAKVIGGDEKLTEMELLSKILGISIKDDPQKKTNLNDIITGMQVQKEKDFAKKENPISGEFLRNTFKKYDNRQQDKDFSKKEYPNRAEFVRKSFKEYDNRQQDRPQYSRKYQDRPPRKSEGTKRTTKVDLFGSEPLGIFTSTQGTPTEFLKTWEYLEKRELRLSITHPPSNYFEKMALWTEQGKLWRFPIDNEQDIGAEKEVDFTEHIFLEEHLEPWCPKKGPVRHFMELVTVGLSKNPYMSVQEKHDHINYYKEYFESKKDVLQKIIVETKKEEPKEISSQ